jgi:hypothetical protein
MACNYANIEFLCGCDRLMWIVDVWTVDNRGEFCVILVYVVVCVDCHIYFDYLINSTRA